MDDDPIIYVCAGPPLCDGPEGDQCDYMETCELCKRIVCHPDGTETITERQVH